MTVSWVYTKEGCGVRRRANEVITGFGKRDAYSVTTTTDAVDLVIPFSVLGGFLDAFRSRVIVNIYAFIERRIVAYVLFRQVSRVECFEDLSCCLHNVHGSRQVRMTA
jgi:hypothetical protein